MTTPQPPVEHYLRRRFLGATNLGVFLLSVLAVLVVMNFFALRPGLRSQVDTTKTRAYSLSPQTMALLEGLEGPWSVSLLMSPSQIDSALRRQIDEVLRRFADVAPDLEVHLIDPSDARSLAEYDATLLRLQSIYGDLVDAYDQALDDGEAAFEELHLFAQQQASSLQSLVPVLPAQAVEDGRLEARAMAVNLLATQADQVKQVFRDARRVDDVQPIPDYDVARSVLVSALTDWSNQLLDIALLFDQWQQLPNLDPDVLRYLSNAKTVYDETAQHLTEAADPLARLEPLELSNIGRRMQEGECALVIGPSGAAAIPSGQLFPKTNIGVAANAAVTFDQRFRGEQVIASTIRSLLSEQMPLVVFVHGDEQSLFSPKDDQTDLVGLRFVLATARFEAVEWGVALNSVRPQPDDGQPVVWVIVPPTARVSIEPSAGEHRLIATTLDLIADGEAVMVNAYPSPLVRFGQRDPWQPVMSSLGVAIDTSSTIFELIRTGAGETIIEHGQVVVDYGSQHPIAGATEGLPAYFGLPMPIAVAGSSTTGFSLSPVASVEPTPTRWLEPEWFRGVEGVRGVRQDALLQEPATIIMAAQRPHTLRSGTQRGLVVSSGGWMLTYVADRVYSIGGDRVVLEFPGNYELFLASVAWLAGADDLIAPSPVSQEVARLRSVTPQARRRWLWLTVAALPGACIGLGLMVWFARRF